MPDYNIELRQGTSKFRLTLYNDLHIDFDLLVQDFTLGTEKQRRDLFATLEAMKTLLESSGPEPIDFIEMKLVPGPP